MAPKSWRRLGASVAAVAVTAALTTVTAPAQADTPTAQDQGADWLAGQLTDGLIHNDQYDSDDYGLSIDTALALKAVGGHASEVDAVKESIETHLADYITGDAYGDTGSTYSGATAKSLVFAQVAGADPTSFGGEDLVHRLEQQVKTSSPITGRLFDTSSYGDYANTIGQAYAARGLADAGSSEAGDVLDFLLEQQCSAGFFRLNFTADKTAADQTCDGGTASGDSPADPDVTSLAMIELQPLADGNAEVEAALTKAQAWLSARQHADGSFNGGTSTDVPNANSTGLAGWALGERGDDTAAASAAVWIRKHQAQPLKACPTKLAQQSGAVAYDNAALKDGRASGITTAAQDQWRRASAQSVPVLQWLPTTTGTPTLTVPAGFHKAGSKVTIRASQATPGAAVCVRIRSTQALGAAGGNGGARVRVTLPKGTANRIVRLTDGTTTRTARIKVLGKKKLTVKAPKKAKRGKKVTVRIAGLAAKEKLTVRRGSKVVRRARAGAAGRFHFRMPVGKKAGKVRIKVTGQFPGIRKGARTVKVAK